MTKQEQQVIELLAGKGPDIYEYVGKFEEAQPNYEHIKQVAHEIEVIYNAEIMRLERIITDLDFEAYRLQQGLGDE